MEKKQMNGSSMDYRKGGRKGGRKRRPRGRKRPRRRTKVVPYIIPDDILQQIFHILPLKTLARFKLTCKRWNSLISDSQFMKHTFYRILGGKNHLITSTYQIEDFGVYTIDYNNGDYLIHNNTAAIRLSPSMNDNNTHKFDYQSALFLGSCNGLVALVLECKNYVLWNPFTGQYTSLIGDSLYKSDYFQVGLCYDALTDEYSVVFVSIGSKTKISVVNFQDSSCSRKVVLEEEPKPFAGGVGKVICGVPHWIGTRQMILYFDVKDEKFKIMQIPDLGGGKRLMLGLATMDGESELGVVLHNICRSNLEVWVMKEYGNSSSWMNLFTVPYLNEMTRYLDVMGFMETKKLLISMGYNRGLWDYDLEEGSLRQIKTNLRSITSEILVAYEPSLTSPLPKPGKRKKKREERKLQQSDEEEPTSTATTRRKKKTKKKKRSRMWS